MITIESGEFMRWGTRFGMRAIIGAALAAVLLLSGCASLLRVTYGQAPTLAYWWIDGYVDLNGEQTPRLRDALDRWFDWHRRVELPQYAALLARAQREVTEPVTTQGMCAWRAEAERRLDAAVDQALPAASALIVSLTPEQLRHMQAKLAKDGAELKRDFAQTDRTEREQRSFKRALERFENLYGRLDEAQRTRLAKELAASPFDADRWLAERERRVADTMRMLASASTSGDPAQAQAAVRVLVERSLRSPRSDYREYQEKLAQDNCALAATMHNLTTPAQRRVARDKLKGWEDDLRALMGSGSPT
jgi:FtsZ-binding cell division protein ZapB